MEVKKVWVQQCSSATCWSSNSLHISLWFWSCHIPDNKRLSCTFNLVLPGGPCAWRARSNSESFETSPGSVPVPWTKNTKSKQGQQKILRELRCYPKGLNITEMQAAVVILTRTMMPSNDTFSDSTCCWWLWWLRLLLLYDCHKTWLSWFSLAASEMLLQWCLHDMRKGGSFW